MEHLEGQVSVLAALLARRRRIEVVLIAHGGHEDKFADILAAAAAVGAPVRFVDRTELQAMTHGRSHGGVVCVAGPVPRLEGSQLLQLLDQNRKPALLLLLEGVDDARNLGFTIRSAEALGADALLVKKHLWDFDAVEVSRPASGAYERLPLVQIDDVQILRQLQKRGVQCLGCIAGARRDIYSCDLRLPTLLAIGGEKRGLSGATREACDGFCNIPTAAAPSSLALSHAAAIVLAEANRQRR